MNPFDFLNYERTGKRLYNNPYITDLKAVDSSIIHLSAGAAALILVCTIFYTIHCLHLSAKSQVHFSRFSLDSGISSKFAMGIWGER